jgi:two-component system, LytTR family, response regulator
VNALIVDDERLARQEMRRLLEPHPDIVVIGEARNTEDAEERLRSLPVDLMLLDIRMPGATGFDLLERLDRVPFIIFTTAHNEHALRAFEVNAFDYLLKPIRPERLAAALEKVRSAWKPAVPAEPGTRGAGIRSVTDRVFLRDGERCFIVTIGDIACFEGEGNYARVVVGGQRPLIRSTIAALEARLDPAVFFRASRRYLINVRHIERVDLGVDDSYTVRLTGGLAVPISRRQSRHFRERLGL